MIYKMYGKTGIKVSALGFGGMRFENQNDIDACAGLIRHAYHSDINYFDTAPGYGKSEDLFGVAFKEMKKTRAEKPFYVSTKSNKSQPDEVRTDLENSLKRMNLDYIDFFHMWCIITYDEFLERRTRGVLDELEKLKSEGLIRHICVSTHMTGTDIGTMLRQYPFEGVLLGYSIMNFAYRNEGMDTAAELGNGIVVMNPLGGGLIPQHPERFEFVKTHPDQTVIDGALHFLINDPRVTVALVGFGTESHLQHALHAVNTFQPLPESRVESIKHHLQQAFNELCTACQYCDDCPEGIPIPKLMDAYNQYLLSGKPKDMFDRLKWHWGISLDEKWWEKCIECAACEAACTQKLPIMQRLEDMGDQVAAFQKSNKNA